jgi:hypothetical protein
VWDRGDEPAERLMRRGDAGRRVKATLGTAALGQRQSGAPRKIQNVA